MEVEHSEKELGEMLNQLYQAQQHILFQDMVMKFFLEKTGLKEEEIILALKKMIARQWLVCDGVKRKFFLRPNYVQNFPVIVSSAGLEYLEQQGLK